MITYWPWCKFSMKSNLAFRLLTQPDLTTWHQNIQRRVTEWLTSTSLHGASWRFSFSASAMTRTTGSCLPNLEPEPQRHVKKITQSWLVSLRDCHFGVIQRTRDWPRSLVTVFGASWKEAVARHLGPARAWLPGPAGPDFGPDPGHANAATNFWGRKHTSIIATGRRVTRPGGPWPAAAAAHP